MNDREPIPIKEKLSFHDIFSDNRIKPIKWSDEFYEWPFERQLNYAQKLASAMNEAADKMQEDRDRVLGILQDEHAKREEAEKAALIAKQTLQNAVTKQNERVQVMQKEIQSLQARLEACQRAQ